MRYEDFLRKNVKVGDKVKKGTLIATPTGLGANIFSSVYGVVEDVKEDRIIIVTDAEQPEARQGSV